MNKENKKVEKFKFVTMDELNHTNNEPSNRVNSEGDVFDFDVSKDVTVHTENVEPQSSPKNTRYRIHFSFEARIVSMVVLILLMFGSACFLILEAVNYGKSEIVTYDETSKVNYQVCLTKNDYYDHNCLEENMEYVSSLTNNIPVSFSYNVGFSTPISYDIAYHVVAVTKIYDRDDVNKVLYKNEEILVEKTDISNTDDTISFDVDVPIDYLKYNKNVTDYKNRYSLNSSADVEVVLYLDEVKETRKVASLTIPLGSSTYGITKNVLSNTNRSVEINKDSWNQYNTVCAIVASLLILLSLILVYRTTRLVLKVTTNRNKYQQRLSQILREYDRIIVIARDGYESNAMKSVIKVANFDELLDARDTLGKPIVYSRINDVKSEFIVEDDDKLFKYVLKESDL